MATRTCLICGTEFMPSRKTIVCCTDQCKEQRKVDLRNDRYQSKRTEIIAANSTRYWTNREEVLRFQKKYNPKKSEDAKAKRAANPEQCRLKANEYSRQRHRSNIQVRLAHRLRSRLNVALRNNYKTGSAVADLGCTIKELQDYLESLFLPGMSWTNWNRHGWHIDHKRALSTFDLTDREQFKMAVHFTNLQPMWAPDNIRKGNK